MEGEKKSEKGNMIDEPNPICIFGLRLYLVKLSVSEEPFSTSLHWVDLDLRVLHAIAAGFSCAEFRISTS